MAEVIVKDRSDIIELDTFLSATCSLCVLYVQHIKHVITNQVVEGHYLWRCCSSINVSQGLGDSIWIEESNGSTSSAFSNPNPNVMYLLKGTILRASHDLLPVDTTHCSIL